MDGIPRQLDSLNTTIAKQMAPWREPQEMAIDQICGRVFNGSTCSHATTQKEKWLCQGYCLGGDGQLDLSVASEDIKAITIRNAQDSPLLRLPLEIRDKIYEHTLGAYRISIYEDTHKKKQGPTFEHWALAGVSAPAVVPGRVVHAIEHWRYKDSMNPGRLPHLLGMLSACRQIYEDAALLLYQLNTLHFPQAPGAKRWLQCRNNLQKHAMSRLDLSCKPDDDISDELLAEELPGLKVIYFRYLGNRTMQEKREFESRTDYWCSRGVSVVEYCRIMCQDDHGHKHMEAGPCWCRKHDFLRQLHDGE